MAPKWNFIVFQLPQNCLAIFHKSRHLNWRDVGGGFGASTLVSIEASCLRSVIFWASKCRATLRGTSQVTHTHQHQSNKVSQTPPIQSPILFTSHTPYIIITCSAVIIVTYSGRELESDFYDSCHNRIMLNCCVIFRWRLHL